MDIDDYAQHGLMTALVVYPGNADMDEVAAAMNELGLGDAFSVAEVQRAIREIEEQLSGGHGDDDEFTWPDENVDLEQVCDWCAGFMLGHFIDEARWFEKDENWVAEVLLPIMVLSGLFEDEEMERLAEDEERIAQWAEDIPEIVQALYLHYRVSE